MGKYGKVYMAQKHKMRIQVDKNIYQRGEYSYQVKMMIGGHKINKTLDSLAEAQTYRDLERGGAALDHTEGAIYQARVKKRESKSFKFSDAIQDYRAKSEKKKGYKQESASLDLLSRLPIASKPLFMIHKEDIISMFDDIRSGQYRKNRIEKSKNAIVKGASEATARRYANLARHIFEVAVKDWKKLDRNPFEELGKDDKPKDGKPRNRRFEGDEYERLKKVLSMEAKAALIVFVESAMRKGELLKMEWQNLTFNGSLGTVKLIDTKNGDERIVPLSSIAITALRTLPRGISGKVFKLTSSMLNHRWRAARESIGSPDLRVHDLRHEATSRLFEDKGLNVVEAVAVTGHKSLQMLKRYANLNPELLAKKLG